MAIVVEDASSTIGNGNQSVSDLTVASGEVLIAAVGIHQGTISDVTWNGVSMTQGPNAATAFNERAEIWYDLTPATGNNTLTLSVSGGGASFVCGLRISGVKATGQPDQTNTATGSDASIENSVTPSSDNSLIIDSVYSEATLSSADANQTIQANEQAQSFQNGGCSTHLQGSAASREMGWDLSSGQRWASAVLSLEEAAAAVRRVYIIS